MLHIYRTFYETENSPAGKREKDVAGQRKTEEGSIEHRIGRELLCRGLRELYGIDVSSVDSLLAEGQYGKPFLKDHPEIHFNISHCSGLVVCAFAGEPVGIDVENVKPVRDPLIRRVLHEEELRVLSRYGQISENKRPVDQPERSREFLRLFFRYWTLKESYLKQDGSGLTKEPREICFYVDPDDWDSPVRLSDPEMICTQKLIIGPMEGGEEYVLSVCLPEKEMPV